MKYNIHFTIKGPAGFTEATNNTNPVDAPDLKWLLKKLSDHLPGNTMLGIQTVGLRIEPTAGGEQDEYDPSTGENLTGRVEPCCECGEEYPRADLVVRGEIYCPKCRVVEAKRKQALTER